MAIGLFAVFPPLFYFLYPCIMDKQITEHQAIEEQKNVTAFNDAIIKIWKEQITLLSVIDTIRLLRSPMLIGQAVDGTHFLGHYPRTKSDRIPFPILLSFLSLLLCL